MKIIVYLSLDPQKAKADNLPVSLPLLEEDFEMAAKNNRLDPDMIIRGLRAQIETGKKIEYYLPYFVYFLYDRARFYMNMEKLQEAREAVEEAASYKQDYRYPLHLGIIERLSGNPDRSEILLKEAIAMNSEYLPSRIELGRTLMEQSQFEEVIETCKEIMEIDPSFTITYLLMGDAYLAIGDAKSAITLYQQALTIDHDLQSVHWRIGVAANMLQRFSLAENEFKISLSKNEGGWHVKYDLSYSLYREGKIFEAIQLLSEIQRSGVETSEVLTEMVILQKTIGLYEEALETVEKGMDMEIKAEGFLLASIDVYAFNGMIDKALALVKSLPSESASPRKRLLGFEDKWQGRIDLRSFVKLIDTSRPEIKSKIEDLKNDLVSGNQVFDVTMLSILNEVVKFHGIHFYSAESSLTRAAMAFSGSIETIGLFILLYRIYFYTHALDYKLEDAIEIVIPQITDISWKIGYEVAKVFESDEIIDIEDMSQKLENPVDVAKFFVSVMILENEENRTEFLKSLNTPEIVITLIEMIDNQSKSEKEKD